MLGTHTAEHSARSVTFLTEDGTQLRGTYWDPRDERSISLLLVHDQGANRSVWDQYVPLFRSRGWSVLAFDLRGHGESVRQEMRANLLPPGAPELPRDVGYPMDIRAALAFMARQPHGDPAKRAVVGLGLGADLAYAAAARGWGSASTVCVSVDDARSRVFAGIGQFQPRSAYLVAGALDPASVAAALAFSADAVMPAETKTYVDTASRGCALWGEQQPEIVARSIAWIERTI